jgi:AcrR family transcriptional regulator
MLAELNSKDADIEAVAERAAADEALVSELLDGLESRNETYRYNCFKVLLQVSEEHSQVLYPRWDRFVKLLSSSNTYQRLSALQLIANLTRVDTENRFEGIFDLYFGLLDDPSVIPAAHLARAAGRIVNAKPELEPRITDRLLSIDETHHDPERRHLIKGYALEAFAEYFETAGDRDRIVDFVKEQVDGGSPRTRKAARGLLKEWGRL